jgi:hypothetical protein
MKMASFRYRTATLLGPWRASAEAAVEDAIRAKQARRDENGETWHWVVPGAIEEGHGAPLASSGNDELESSAYGRDRG